MTPWGRVLRAPAVHFLVLGGLLFLVDARRSTEVLLAPAAGPKLTDEEILWREAVAAGLARTDPLVRARLVGLARFLETNAVEDAAHLEDSARRLGLARTDLVVRRHLVQAMELALARGGPREWPDDAVLADYVERHRERFVRPARVRFSHVFFARDRLGDAPAAAAAATLARLQRAPAGASVAGGDAFLAGVDIAGSEDEVARTFGPAFTAAVTRLPAGRWTGPMDSVYGVHLVRVHERTPAVLPPVAAVHSQAVHGVLAEQAAARLARRLAERRARYESVDS